MADEVFDTALARYLCQLGIVTGAQVEAARQVQATAAPAHGGDVSLAAALVQLNHITKAQRAKAEQEVKARLQGTRIGQYRLLRKLGEGSMGSVYLAEDTVAQRNVALKVLPRKYCGDPHFLMRFQREVRAAGNLNHANTAAVYTVGEDAGQHFIVVEYCEGESLDKILKRERALPWDQALEIVAQVARGLQHAHERDTCHRDLKPANIMVTDAGVAKILDMGLPRMSGAGEQSFGTQAGAAPRAYYISPEQARGDKELDGRTDIYSLGATFYHMLTGETPFQGPGAAVSMTKRLEQQLPNPQDIRDDIPDGVAQVLQKMMAREPADRYRGCAELLDDLELVLSGGMPSSQAMDAALSSVAGRTRPARGSHRQLPPSRRVTKGSGLERVPSTRGATPQPLAGVRPRTALGRPAETAPTQVSPAPSRTTAYIAVGVGVAVLALGLAIVLSRRPEPQSEAHKTTAAPQPSRADVPPQPAPVQPARPTPPSATGGQSTEPKRPVVAAAQPAPAKPPEEPRPAAKAVQPAPQPDTGNAGTAAQTATAVPQPAVPAMRTWRPVFDGRTLDFLKGQGRGAWRVENGAIVNVPGTNDAAQTVQQFSDGDIRIRFEASGNDRMFFTIRQGDGGYKLVPNGTQLAAMAAKPQELVFSCRGDNVTATLNGQQVALDAGRPLRTGSLQFNAQGGSMRVLSIEHGDVLAEGSSAPTAAAAPRPDTTRVVPWQPIFDGRTLDCLNGQGQGAWSVENGALVSVAGVQRAVPTAREFGDGQIRICFEVSGVKYMDIKVRQRPEGGICATFDKPQLTDMGNKPQELIFTCRGPDVSAALNGQPMQLGGEARPLKGWVRFYVGNGTLRVLSLEYRELLPDGTAATLSAAPPAPVFPPMVEERARAAMQVCDRVLELLAKTDLDSGTKLDQALRLAKSGTAPELQPLAKVLEKAQALHEQAAANIAKQPPTEPVRVEKLNLTGTVVRVADGKAFIKSQGMELPVDLALLPQAVFMKALAFDDAKPAGIADKAAYFLGMGNVEGAQQLLKRVKKEDAPAWAALFEQRAGWARLLKFEASVSTIEAALKSSKTADALAALNALKKDYPELVEANKERITYLLGMAEGAK